jgi:hypothetical protein
VGVVKTVAAEESGDRRSTRSKPATSAMSGYPGLEILLRDSPVSPEGMLGTERRLSVLPIHLMTT